MEIAQDVLNAVQEQIETYEDGSMVNFEIVKSKIDQCENICKQAYLNNMTKNIESSIYNQNSVYLDPYNENNDNSENEDIY